MVRLGGHGLPVGSADPFAFARAHRDFGYAAAYVPASLTMADSKLLEFFPYASDKAIVVDTALGVDALEVNYRFDGSPPAELGQGVITLDSAGKTRWLELATPWPPL